MGELRDFIQDQVGFRSDATVISMSKASPEIRRVMHKDLQNAQITSVKKQQKIYGAESCPVYDMSPQKLKSKILESRVFKTPKVTNKKKRVQSAKSVNFRNYQLQNLPMSKYSDPNQRPNIKNPKPNNAVLINTKFSSDNKTF